MKTTHFTIEYGLSTEEALRCDITYFETQISKLNASRAYEHQRMLIVYRSLVGDLSRRLLKMRLNAPRSTRVV